MLFSSYIVIRTTSSWMRSCPITRFDTKNANVKELPNFESCSSPAPWGLLVFWILETVPHCVPRPKNSCSQSFPHALSASATVGSTACTCVLDSLYSPWHDTLPHWCCPSLQQVDYERSAASTMFSQRHSERSKPVQNAALRASEIRILPHKLRKRRSLPFCTTSGVRRRSVQRRRTPWMSELSSRLLKALLRESLPYP